jgi:ferredoxin-NADP reductase
VRLASVIPFRRLIDPLVGPLVSTLATPLVPEDFLRLVDPLWSSTELHGRVQSVRRETADATSLVIRPGRRWAGPRAGQYLPVGVDVDGVRHWRTYSISTPPGSPLLTITVKAVPGGRVSPRLAQRTAAGEVLRLGPAGGEFVLPGATPSGLLFVTAGSGITPVAAMLRELASGARAGTDVVLVHSAPTPADVIFGTELRGLPARVPGVRLHEHHTRTAGSPGRLTAADVAALCPDWATRATYACGPDGLLRDLAAHWSAAGREDRLHVERFRVPDRVGAAGGPRRGGSVRFTATGLRAQASGRTPLLEVGENAGVLMPSGCRQGICHTCLAPLRSGRVRDLRTGREHGEPGDLIQTCVSAAAGSVEIDL